MNLNKLKGKIVENNVDKDLLAQKLGYSIQNLNNKLTGRTKIHIEEVPIFCDVIGITDDNEKVEIFLS